MYLRGIQHLMGSESLRVCKLRVLMFSDFPESDWTWAITHYADRDILFRVQPKLRYFDFPELFARQINFEKAWKIKASEAHLLHSTSTDYTSAHLRCRGPVQCKSQGPLPTTTCCLAWITNILSEIRRTDSEWERDKDPWQDHGWVNELAFTVWEPAKPQSRQEAP